MGRPLGFEPYADLWTVEYAVAQNTVRMCGIFPFVFGSSVHRTAFFGTKAEMDALVLWVKSQRHGPTYDTNPDGTPKLGTYTNYNLIFSGELRWFNRKSFILAQTNDVGLKN